MARSDRSDETQAEMERVEAILSLYEASGSNAKLARAIAFTTDLSVEQARGALQAAERDARKGMPVSRDDQHWDRFFCGRPS
jgi:hypothetical protein